jgi:hypothetical protein
MKEPGIVAKLTVAKLEVDAAYNGDELDWAQKKFDFVVEDAKRFFGQ